MFKIGNANVGVDFKCPQKTSLSGFSKPGNDVFVRVWHLVAARIRQITVCLQIVFKIGNANSVADFKCPKKNSYFCR